MSFQLVGQVAGSYFGPVGSAIGGFLGAALDSSLSTLPTQYGPRLSDRAVQLSTYGATIPELLGEAGRLGGNVIWVKDNELEEVEEVTEVGGKGAPSQTIINYSYFATFAVLLCNRSQGVRRIWADTVLVYDGITASSLDFVFYNGSDDQLPDPTIEASIGVGNVSAWRGRSYIVFNRMPLGLVGNRIPNITVELVGAGDFGIDATNLSTPAADHPFDGVQRIDGMIVRVQTPTVGTVLLEVVDPTTGEVTLSATHPYTITWGGHDMMCYVPPTNEVWVAGGPGAYRFDADTLAFIAEVNSFGSGIPQLEYDPVSRNVLARPGAYYAVAGGEAVVLIGNVSDIEILAHGVDVDGVHLGSGGFSLEGVEIFESMGATVDTLSVSSGAYACWDGLRHRYVVVDGSDVYTITDANPPVVTNYTPVGLVTYGGECFYDSGTDTIVSLSQVADSVTVAILDAETFEVLEYESPAAAVGAWWAFPMPDTPGAMFVQGRYQAWQLDFHSATYGEAVRRLATMNGELESADLDVSDLGMRLRGYIVGQQVRARDAIDHLLHAAMAECVEEDDVLVFRRRGGASVATITADECGAGFDTAADQAITWTRADEIGLPSKVTVTAPDPARDYQTDAQYTSREVGLAGEPQTLQLGVVLTADEQIRLSASMTFAAWAGRERAAFSTSRKYARLVPTDPITLDGRRVRITGKDDQGGVINWEAETDDADVVDQVVDGVVGDFPNQEIQIIVPTIWGVMDMSLLRDAENDPGAYVWFYGVDQWRGGVLLGSADDGVSWEREATLPRPGSSVGTATTALANWTGGNRFDEVSSVNVVMSNGTGPASYTRAAVLAGSGVFAIQSEIDGDTCWEVCQARTATLEADGSYTLTGLLRGRRGTGWAMSGHAVGNRVVLLDATSIRNISIENSQIGVALDYRGVSIGDTIEATTNVEETITAERLKPWSPVDLRAARDVATADITLTWKRRTRLSCRFVGGGGINVPLGEASEAYEVEIWDSSYTTLKRTITGLSTASATYSVAAQTTDFGSAQSTVYVRVFQLSDVVDRGHTLQAAA